MQQPVQSSLKVLEEMDPAGFLTVGATCWGNMEPLGGLS